MQRAEPKRGSCALAAREAEKTGGPVLFCGQKPYSTWELRPPDEPGADALATAPVEAKLNRAATPADKKPDAAPAEKPDRVAAAARPALRLPLLPIAGVGLGLVALTLAALFVAPLVLRAPPAPKTALAALPALAVAPPPLALAPNSQTAEPEPLSALEPPPPIQIGVPQEEDGVAAPAPDAATIVPPPLPPVVLAPLPPSRPLELAPPVSPAIPTDQTTAIYDISAHTVYLPDGTRLEAHSGLGDRIDDPRFVDERDRGATPPGVYQLTLRELLFHGVQALRLNPIGAGFTFNRVGLLAHPYMLGPNGDSNGCVSFKTYDVFLRAFQSGTVKRLAVVAHWTGGPRAPGVFAGLREALNRTR